MSLWVGNLYRRSKAKRTQLCLDAFVGVRTRSLAVGPEIVIEEGYFSLETRFLPPNRWFERRLITPQALGTLYFRVCLKLKNCWFVFDMCVRVPQETALGSGKFMFIPNESAEAIPPQFSVSVVSTGTMCEMNLVGGRVLSVVFCCPEQCGNFQAGRAEMCFLCNWRKNCQYWRYFSRFCFHGLICVWLNRDKMISVNCGSTPCHLAATNCSVGFVLDEDLSSASERSNFVVNPSGCSYSWSHTDELHRSPFLWWASARYWLLPHWCD